MWWLKVGEFLGSLGQAALDLEHMASYVYFFKVVYGCVSGDRLLFPFRNNNNIIK